MQFLLDNPLLILAAVMLLMAVFAYNIVKPRKKSKTKEKTKEKKQDENLAQKDTIPVSTEKIEKDEQSSNDEESKTEDVDKDIDSVDKEKKEENGKQKKKVKKTKREITRVYEKKQIEKRVEQTDEDEKLTEKEEEFLKKMQFVKSGGKVSRLKPYVNENEENFEDQAFEIVEQENFEQVEDVEIKKTSRFDRTRRLSKLIQEDSLDNMFCSHISDKYMNMDDFERHLRSCNEVQEKLYQRAVDTMVNSESRMSAENSEKIQELKDRGAMSDWLEQRRRQELAKIISQDTNEEFEEEDAEDIVENDDLSARTFVVVDSLLNRKGKISRKR